MSVTITVSKNEVVQERKSFEQSVIKVGRGPHNDLVLNDRSVSGSHCEVHVDASGSLRVLDPRSTHGTFVAGERVRGERVLSPGQIIEVCAFQLVVEQMPAQPSPSEPRRPVAPTGPRKTVPADLSGFSGWPAVAQRAEDPVPDNTPVGAASSARSPSPAPFFTPAAEPKPQPQPAEFESESAEPRQAEAAQPAPELDAVAPWAPRPDSGPETPVAPPKPKAGEARPVPAAQPAPETVELLAPTPGVSAEFGGAAWSAPDPTPEPADDTLLESVFARALAAHRARCAEQPGSSRREHVYADALAAFDPSVRARAELAEQIADEICRQGPLKALFDDAEVEELFAVGNAPIVVTRRGRREMSEHAFTSGAALEFVAGRLAERPFDGQHPVLAGHSLAGDAIDGVHASLSASGSVVCIRRSPGGANPRLTDLVRSSPEAMSLCEQLTDAVHEKRNILVTGRPGLRILPVLSALARGIESTARLVVLAGAGHARAFPEHAIVLDAGGSAATRPLGSVATAMGADHLFIHDVGATDAGEVVDLLTGGAEGLCISMRAPHAGAALEHFGVLANATRMGGDVQARVRRLAASISLIIGVSAEGRGAARIAEVYRVATTADGEPRLESLIGSKSGIPSFPSATDERDGAVDTELADAP